MNLSACTITGHRPAHFSFGYDEEHPRCTELKRALALQIENMAYAGGITTFYTGMALGVDIWAAQVVLNLKYARPDVRLVAVLPCETQADRWSAEQRHRWFECQQHCDEVVVLHSAYVNGSMQERNRYLVDHAEHLLAVYDGGAKGGTAYTVNYARRLGRHITVLQPDSLQIVSDAASQVLERRSAFSCVDGKKGAETK